MPDDKRGRERQAREADRRRRQRELLLDLERGDETEPPVDEETLDDIEGELDDLVFPATGAEVVDAVGGQAVAEGHTVADLVPATETEWFRTPRTVRVRLLRPTVAGAMKRIAEASAEQGVDFDDDRKEVFEKTLRELRAIEADDEDEGVRVVTDWIVERIHETERLPSSRAVRREAGEFCRANDYPVRNDEWLGI